MLRPYIRKPSRDCDAAGVNQKCLRWRVDSGSKHITLRFVVKCGTDLREAANILCPILFSKTSCFFRCYSMSLEKFVLVFTLLFVFVSCVRDYDKHLISFLELLSSTERRAEPWKKKKIGVVISPASRSVRNIIDPCK